MLRSGLVLLMILLAAPACAGSRFGGGFHGGGRSLRATLPAQSERLYRVGGKCEPLIGFALGNVRFLRFPAGWSREAVIAAPGARERGRTLAS